MQISSEILLQYIYNHNLFYMLYCHVFGDAPLITCYFTVLHEFKTHVAVLEEFKTHDQLSRRPSGLGIRLEIKGSLVRYPAEIYIFIKKNFACLPSLQVAGTLAYEIKHDHSPLVIVVLDPRYD